MELLISVGFGDIVIGVFVLLLTFAIFVAGRFITRMDKLAIDFHDFMISYEGHKAECHKMYAGQDEINNLYSHLTTHDKDIAAGWQWMKSHDKQHGNRE